VRSKPHRRPKALRVFTGTIEIDELHARGARLKINRGAERRTLDDEGNQVSETYEPGAVPPSNIGDRLIVMGPGVHEVDAAKVITVYPCGTRMYVKLASGAIEKTTTKVKLLAGGKR
jgi:hypothetical protein